MDRIKAFFGFRKRQPRSRLEAAADPAVLLRLSQALKWAYWNGYRPVPGFTVCEREENGDLYVAVQMTKEK